MLFILDKLIEYAFYALVFATPLIFNPSRTSPSSELFEWNKMMFVYVITVLVVGAWIGRMILRRKFIYKPTPFDLPILLFLGSQILATIFSIDPHVSIFGYYSRFHGGLLSIICYTLLFFAFIANSKLVSLPRLIMFALASGTVVAGYGVAEHFGIDARMWVQDVRSRVFSTLGQPNWLAAYLAILLPLTIYKIITPTLTLYSSLKSENQKSKINPPSASRRSGQNGKEIFIQILLDNWIIGIYWIIGLLFYLCLLYTRSRSGFLGFWIANIIFWILILGTSKGARSFLRVQGYKLSALLLNNTFKLFFILNSSFLILNFFVRTPFPQYNKLFTRDILQKQAIQEEIKLPVGETIISVGITNSSNIRKIVWKGAFSIIKNFPLFGTGPETFAYAYYRFRPAEHNLTSEWDFLYNRAHNEFLNIAATSGLTGLATYVFFITVVIIYGIKHIVKTSDKANPYLHAALVASFISILITNFFGFSVVIIGIYFFLIPAFLWKTASASALTDAGTPSQFTGAHLSSRQKVLGLVTALGVLLALFTLYRFWGSDSLYAQALSTSKQNALSESYKLINRAIDLRSDEPNFYDEKANITSALAQAAFEQQNATLAAELADESLKSSTAALKVSPQNVIFWKTRTRLLFMLSAFATEFNEEALKSILVARELAPTDPRISYNVGVLYGRLKKNQEAISELKKTIELKPDYRDAYLALSIFYEDEKQIDKARTSLEFILVHIDPNDKEVQERLEKLKLSNESNKTN